MSYLSHSLNNERNRSAAGAELWALYNTLADDTPDDQLLGKFDAYVDDLSVEAQNLYRKLTK
jgi:hypothetical protein